MATTEDHTAGLRTKREKRQYAQDHLWSMLVEAQTAFAEDQGQEWTDDEREEMMDFITGQRNRIARLFGYEV